MTMTFRLELRRPSAKLDFDDENPATEEELREYETLVMYACGLLDDTDAEFSMSGFSEQPWWVDVGYDLSSVLEGLPKVLELVRTRTAGELYLYPQGLDRTLKFTPVENGMEITCVPDEGSSWAPEWATELVGYAELEAMLVELAAEFAASLRLIKPELARYRPFPDWLNRSV